MSQKRRTHGAKRQIDCALRGAAPSTRKASRTYWQVVNVVRERSQILAGDGLRPYELSTSLQSMILACQRVASHPCQWIRPLEAWVPGATGPIGQFRTLMAHLFEAYPVPNFLPLSWMAESYQFADWHRLLYLHMARGFGVRNYAGELPLKLNRKAAAWLCEAPDDLPPHQALRWAQFRGQGCPAGLARLLIESTLLEAPTSDEPFWETVIRFLVREGPIPDDEVVAIVEFLHAQRFEPGETVWGRGGGLSPLQPQLSLKGRTLHSLRRQMLHWREELLAKRPELIEPSKTWPPIDVAPLEYYDGGAKWTIRELLNDRSLDLEGQRMHHCVGTYAEACAMGRSSIWSMRVEVDGRRERVCTIEVCPTTRQVVQAKAKLNRMPSESSREMLRHWAERERLTLMCPV